MRSADLGPGNAAANLRSVAAKLGIVETVAESCTWAAVAPFEGHERAAIALVARGRVKDPGGLRQAVVVVEVVVARRRQVRQAQAAKTAPGIAIAAGFAQVSESQPLLPGLLTALEVQEQPVGAEDSYALPCLGPEE